MKQRMNTILLQALSPREIYPQDQLKKIKDILDKQNSAEQSEQKYASLISSGDAAFEAKNYIAAKRDFSSALSIKPEESYPKDKLNEIEELLEAERLADLEKKKELDKPIQIKTGPKSTITGDAEAEIERMYKEMWAKKDEERNKVIEEKRKKVKELQDAQREEDYKKRENAIKIIEGISISIQEQNKTADEYHLQNYEVVKEKEEQLKETNTELNINSERNRNNAFADLEELGKEIGEFKSEKGKSIIEGKKEMVEEQYKEQQTVVQTYSNDQTTRIMKASDDNFAKEEAILDFKRELSEKAYTANAEALNKQTEIHTEQVKGYVESSDGRIMDQQEVINDKQLEQHQFTASRSEQFKDNQAALEKQEQQIKEVYEEWNSESEKRRGEMSEREFYQGEDKPRQDPESAELSQGVTEEIIENQNNSTTIRRTVVEGTEVDVYEKTFFPWGEGQVYYSKNGTSITKETWDAESK